MNYRWEEILQELKVASEPVTSSQLSTDLQVSSKTIRNDIKELNVLLKKSDMQIKSYRGKGYQLVMKNENTFRQFLQQHTDKGEEVIPDEPNDRVNFLIERLLLGAGYIKMEELADELYVSRSTLQSDVKTVREILEKYNLSLDQRPNYGIKVIGSESKIRFCISEYIFNQKSVFLEQNTDWSSVQSENDLAIIRNSILTKLRKHNIIISDVSLQNLMTHLAISCKRIQEDNQVEIVHEELHGMKDQKEYVVAEEIMQDIEEKIDVNFPENEVAYLSIHLRGTKLINSDNEKESVKSVLDKKIRILVKEMVERIDEKYHFNLSDDEDLLLNLSLHLEPAINRYKYQMNIRNPMLEDIKTKYPVSFEAALIGSEVLNEKYNISVDEHEIAYLALHIEVAQERLKESADHKSRCLIVCATGLGSAQLLLYKLKARLGDELDVIGTTEYYNLRYHQLENVDFILSTILIDVDLPIPVVHISTILGDRDVDKIERVMNKDKSIIKQYMHEHYTFLNRDFQTPEEIISFMGNELTKNGKVPDDYIDSVLERERYSPTSFGNLVAIPHPLEPKTESTFWTIVTLNKPIQWDDKPVQIVFLLNINKTRKGDLKLMFHTLVEVVDNRKLIVQLLQCKSYQQFRERIKDS